MQNNPPTAKTPITTNMKRNATKFSWCLVFVLVVFSVSTFYADSSSLVDELKQQIDTKNTELEKLEKEIKAYETQIAEAQKSQKTLKSSIASIDGNIKYLRNAIRLAELKISELNSQIFELNNEAAAKENEIIQLKKAIGEAIQEFYEIDRDNIFVAFLRKDTLSDFMEARYHIMNLQNDLNDGLRQFQDLQNELFALQDESKRKKTEQENSKAAMSNRKILVESEKEEKTELLTKTKNQEKVYQQLFSEVDKKRKAIEEEIDALEEKLRLAVDPSSLPSPRSGVLEWPAQGVISQVYGATRFALNHYYSKFHNGIDIALLLGTPLKTAEAGIVLATGNQDKYCYKGAYGKFVVIKHENNLATLYAHLSSIKVAENQEVEKGETIGYSGRTGYATGPHLHFTVYDSRTFEMAKSKSCGPMPAGGSVDPMLYL